MKNVLSFLCVVLCVDLAFGQTATETVYLSGIDAEHTVEWDFLCSAGRKSGVWTKIGVPSCWEQQGFGAYNYGHDKFEDRVNETGTYRHRFNVPGAWKGREVRLVFEGVMTDALVKVNGRQAGAVHQGAFYRFYYDVTKLLKYGSDNELEVFVKKHSDNESVSKAERQADFWIFGGIFRPVYLEVKPVVNVRRVAINADANGKFEADVWLANPRNINVFSVDIQTIDGVSVGKTVFAEDLLWLILRNNPGVNKNSSGSGLTGGSSTDTEMRLSLRIDKPKTWTPESPNLYKAVFTVVASNGQQHVYEQRFGFRTVEVRAEDGIYINGAKIKMKGVDRHTFHPKYGRSSSKRLAIEAVNLMKDMNMNAVRMSHYPPDDFFLDVCDSLGLFVLDELTAWQKPSYDDVVGRMRLEEMIARDVNHPSIIIWDNGNEGGENNNLNDDFAELDIQKRKVIHPWQDYDLTNTLHYFDYNYLALDGFSRRKIFFSTEFLHGLYDGGHGAGLDDYWFRMWNNPLCAGGFLWDFADESVERTDRNGELDSDGNHAPDGILGPYLEKEGSFFTIKEIWSPVFFEKRYIGSDFDGILRIENRYHFTDLKQCLFEYRFVNYPSAASFRSMPPLSLEPLQKGSLKIDMPSDWRTFDALEIRVTDPYGRELNTWSWPLQKASAVAGKLAKASGEKASVGERDGMIEVVSGSQKFVFDKADGRLKSVESGGRAIALSDGPVIIGGKRTLKDVEYSETDGEVSVVATYDNRDRFEWRVAGGLLNLRVSYSPSDNSLYAGVGFTLPEASVAGMRWLGDGPYRVYKNRMKGARFGLWEKAYNNTVTGESGFIYPEFKGYHANVYWVEIRGKNAPDFRVFIASDDIFLRMLTPQEPKFPANTAMTYPEGDLSFLHGINAIGTKFKKPERLGPQSNPYFYSPQRIHGEKLDLEVIFDFRQ